MTYLQPIFPLLNLLEHLHKMKLDTDEYVWMQRCVSMNVGINDVGMCAQDWMCVWACMDIHVYVPMHMHIGISAWSDV